ncbi:hypothetical protein JCM5350_003868 [Sporobolomyces pararoseus]
MIPSVLLPAVHQDPSTPYLDSTPVASTSAVPYTPDEQTIHCSQCNRDLPRSNFPTRLINLQPYQVCRAHEWYWTEAKRAQNWAPEHTSTLQQICDAFEQVARDDGEFEDRFMVNGEERDVDRMVQALARAGNWKLKSMTPRASRAKVSANDPPPPPTWLYAFREQTDPKKVNRFRLTIWFHRTEGKFTMTLKREVKKDRSERPWARPERTKGKAIQRIEGEPGEAERSIPPPPPPDAVRRQSPNVERSQSELSRAQQDAQQMPPPPIPPRKKARRVEPSLVSVPLPRPPASFTSSSTSTLSSSSNQLLPQTDMAFPDALAQLQQSFSNDGASLTLPTPPPSYSSSSNNPFASNPTSTSTSSSQSTTMLTLFEMLNMPAFDPPIIPLPPRNPRPASTTTNNNDHHNNNNNNNNNNNSKRLSNQRQHPQEAQKAPAKAGKELEDAVADILGTRRRTTRSRTRSQEADEEEDLELSGGEEEEEEDEGDYEDSIPDDSSEEGDEDERNEEGRGEEDDDDGSSFFESSAEEYSEQGSGGEEEEEEEEGGVDWFTGFITKQMPGMVNAGDNEEEDDDEEEVREGEIERTSNGSRQSQKEKQNQPNTTSGTPGPTQRKRGRSGSLTGEEDEVDELESSSEE